MVDLNVPLVTVNEVRINADHLRRVSDETLEADIMDAHVSYVWRHVRRRPNDDYWVARWKVIEKYLAQHIATINRRRPDSESIGGMSKSISVPKDKDLDQTEYGQMARKAAEQMGVDLGAKPAKLVIY